MLDPQLLRDDAFAVAEQLAKRGFKFDAKAFIELEEQRKALQVATQSLQNERNTRSKAIGAAVARGENIEAMRAEVNQLGSQLEQKKQEMESILKQIEHIALSLPNLPHASVPLGQDETGNVEIRRWGTFPLLILL